MTAKLPYFDFIINQIEQGNEEFDIAFGKNVHWGYWDNPNEALATPRAFYEATERLTQKVYEAALVKNEQSVLDVGCGFGGTVAAINDHFSNMELVGINIDKEQLERATINTTAQNNNKILFREGNALALPFEDSTFDRVLAVESIFHFQSRKDFFAESFRVLKPNGVLTFTDFVPIDEFLFSMIVINALNIGKDFFGNFYAGYTKKDYHTLAKYIGFKIENEEDITMNTLPTYNFLWSLEDKIDTIDLPILTTICLLNLVNNLKLIQYHVYSFRKS
jgi:ubiquinone/menaquinone biosynthesis C-methylase UbiE